MTDHGAVQACHQKPVQGRGLGSKPCGVLCKARRNILTYMLVVHFLMVFVVVAVIHLNLLMFHF